MNGLRIPNLVLVVALAVTAAAGQVHVTTPSGASTIAERSLPLAFTVREGARLYIRGQQAHEVLIERTDEGSFRVNGVDTYLAPWACIVREERKTEDEQARLQISAKRTTLVKVAHEVYEREREAGLDIIAASAAAFDSMRVADSDSLVDWEASRGPGDGYIIIRWCGYPRSDYDIQLVPERVSRDFVRSEESDRQYATALWYYLCESPDTCWVFVQEGGVGKAYCGSALIADIKAQLTRAHAGEEPGDYPLPAQDIAAVLSAAAGED